MAQPNTQAGLGHPTGAAGQPQVAQRQAPVGEKAMTMPPHRPLESASAHGVPAPHSAHGQPASRTAAPATPAEDDQEGSDWGLAPAKAGISRENKFILFVLLVLVAVFSFVVFRNFQKSGSKNGHLAAKDDKSKGKEEGHEHQKHGDKLAGKSAEADAAPLKEPGHADDPFGNGQVADEESELKEPADDPFKSGPAKDEHAVAAKHRGGHEAGRGRDRSHDEMASEEAPPQLGASMEEAPLQATDSFDAPVENEAQAEFADTSTTPRRGRPQSSTEAELPAEMPSEMVADTPNEITEPVTGDPMLSADTDSQPAAVEGFEVADSTPTNGFEQTGGTTAEPIRQRETSPRGTSPRGTTPRATAPRGTVPRAGGAPHAGPAAAGFDPAQPPSPPAQQEMLNSEELVTETTPRATSPRGTSPRATGPQGTSPRGTAPRSAFEPTPATPVHATQPRVGSVPPPLDPNDPRLGGYREAELPSAVTHRTASRPHTAAPTGQFTPHQEPLVANSGEYIVRPNDNYWRISRKVYGTARYFAALAKHNEASVPDTRHMKPGIKISTPQKELLEQHYGNLLPVMAAQRPVGAVTHSPNAPKTPGFYIEADGQRAYRIGPNDNLSSISQKTLGRATRWEEIYNLNLDRLAQPDALAVGSSLRLPPDASETRVVGKPVEHR